MKTFAALLLVILTTASCGPDSSPEKRMNTKNDKLEQRLNALAQQQQILSDSISLLNKELQSIKELAHKNISKR